MNFLSQLENLQVTEAAISVTALDMCRMTAPGAL